MLEKDMTVKQSETLNFPDGVEIEYLKEYIRKLTHLVEKLDEVMTPPDVIEMQTREVGGFISGVDIVYTAEDVIQRAIDRFVGLKAERAS